MRPFYILIFEFLNLIDLRYRVRTVGNIFDLVRMFFLKKCGVKIGRNSRIGSNVFILNYKNLEIGDQSSIGKNSEIFNYDKVKIGSNVDIGTQLYVNTSNHIFDDKNKPLSKQGSLRTHLYRFQICCWYLLHLASDSCPLLFLFYD